MELIENEEMETHTPTSASISFQEINDLFVHLEATDESPGGGSL